MKLVSLGTTPSVGDYIASYSRKLLYCFPCPCDPSKGKPSLNNPSYTRIKSFIRLENPQHQLHLGSQVFVRQKSVIASSSSSLFFTISIIRYPGHSLDNSQDGGEQIRRGQECCDPVFRPTSSTASSAWSRCSLFSGFSYEAVSVGYIHHREISHLLPSRQNCSHA